ncbi:MAG TPA: hypothetical protein VK927_06760 [Adhaeribacter sp.]|nr:hypothetical protein [Adhaeribacter sp.]
MRKIICISLFCALLTTSCKKDVEVCNKYTELTDRNHLVDISALNAAPEILDSLAKYPQLQVYKIINDQHTIGVHCHVFYQGLKVFTDNYRLFKSKNDNHVYNLEDIIPTAINISLAPSIQFEEAIGLARQNVNFTDQCISYRLGIYDINAATSFQPTDYRLTWRIQGENKFPVVVLDAHTGQVYYKDDGFRE